MKLTLATFLAALCTIVVVVVVAHPPPKSCKSGKRSARILPAFNSRGKALSYAGNTFERWGDIWWQWAFSFPSFAESPLGDTDGSMAYQLQPSDQVFFLAGTTGNNKTITRNVQISRDQFIFFPIYNWVYAANIPPAPDSIDFVNTLTRCAGKDPATIPSFAERVSITAEAMSTYNVADLKTTLIVDGCAQNPRRNFVVTSPLHPLELPTNFSGLEPGNVGAQSGYYVMIAPFKKSGTHNIRIKASSSKYVCYNFSNFELDVKYNLQIV